jgi:glycosyltransferase involved in cell wall biosynthesis
VRKLLLIAPTCDGQDVGEAWVAHQWAKGLGRHHDVTLLTYHKRSSTPAAEQLDKVRVIEWQEPPLVGRAERLNSMLKPGYIPFYVRARRWIRAALAAGERFDLVHQPVPVAMRYPCPAVGLGLPYVIGPVGGGLESPAGFVGDEGSTPWYVDLRRLDGLRLRHDPLLRRTYEQASCVLGIAPYVQDLLQGIPLRRFETLSETAIETVPDPVDRSGRTGPVRLLFVGRLIRTKGARDAIRALSLVPQLPVVLDLVGDGYDRAACEQLTRELGLDTKVRFHGRIPRADVDELYAAADVFVFPSYREPGGNVAFEAMSWGLPLIVSERGGPGNVVDESCGIRLAVQDPQTYAQSIADALRTLVDDPGQRLRLGAGARRRVQEIGLWESKFERVAELYDELAAPAQPPG